MAGFRVDSGLIPRGGLPASVGFGPPPLRQSAHPPGRDWTPTRGGVGCPIPPGAERLRHAPPVWTRLSNRASGLLRAGVDPARTPRGITCGASYDTRGLDPGCQASWGRSGSIKLSIHFADFLEVHPPVLPRGLPSRWSGSSRHCASGANAIFILLSYAKINSALRLSRLDRWAGPAAWEGCRSQREGGSTASERQARCSPGLV